MTESASISPPEITHKEIENRDGGKIPVIVFGNGPVVDPDTGIRAATANTPFGHERVPFWSDNLVHAANILDRHKVADEFFVMGGPTGGTGYASEAALIQKSMTERGISPEKIKIEESSMDTAENLVNFLNEYTAPTSELDSLKVDMLGVSTHLHRLKVYAKFFALPVRHVYAAEEVIRFEARSNEGELTAVSEEWDNDSLTKVERMGDVNTPNPFFSDGKISDKRGTEKKEVADRALDDNLWVREFFEYPQRLLPSMAMLHNDARLRQMVKIHQYVHGDDVMKGLGVDADAPMAVLRESLLQVKWPFLSPDEKNAVVANWRDENVSFEGWPQPIRDKYDRLMDYQPELVPGLPVLGSELR